ncbi:hypothetical protein F2P81_006745 [Scophthalmus maximus]|uniref:Uncharacterized protein n=1 Tax=Scophthalmus maximus TaxID=52904 RepID=A0A6A4T3W4_SCOMX|nr:hypothetical protein F2P81_006745 [Scophthalmus maximus]
MPVLPGPLPTNIGYRSLRSVIIGIGPEKDRSTTFTDYRSTEDELPPRLLLVKVTEDTNRRRLHCFKDEEKEKEPETFKSEFVVDGETIRPRRRRSSMTRGIYSD